MTLFTVCLVAGMRVRLEQRAAAGSSVMHLQTSLIFQLLSNANVQPALCLSLLCLVAGVRVRLEQRPAAECSSDKAWVVADVGIAYGGVAPKSIMAEKVKVNTRRPITWGHVNHVVIDVGLMCAWHMAAWHPKAIMAGKVRLQSTVGWGCMSYQPEECNHGPCVLVGIACGGVAPKSIVAA
jgi:hypothetical protein